MAGAGIPKRGKLYLKADGTPALRFTDKEGKPIRSAP
jgi:hypothetical protein